jgi:outer membrane protein assembly factor BamE (lipoprotein component of BamABCDE complex)
MKNFFIICFISIFITSCTFNKVVKKHGVRFLEKKQKELITNQSNINDIRSLLGPPSTIGNFDTNIIIYIEREITKQPLIKLGKDKLITNNVLVMETNQRGLLIKKDFYDINDMNDLTFSQGATSNNFSKKSFVYDFLSSMRQKINDPLGKRKKP